MASTVPYLFLVGKGAFDKLHDLVLLQIFEYLNNGPFIVSYDKNTRQLVLTIDKYNHIISTALRYKQLHTPYFHTLLIGTKKRLIIKINPHGKGEINDLIWYDINLNTIIHHQTEIDRKRKALITRWNTKDLKNKRQRYLSILKTYSTTPDTTISRDDYIKNTSFRQPKLARSCITK